MDSSLLLRALAERTSLIDPQHRSAARLFNGFYEGNPELAVDLYGRTLLIHDYREPPCPLPEIHTIGELYRDNLPWIQNAIWKAHHSPDPEMRRGQMLFGERPERKVCENGVWYALDLLMHQDASLYLDTRTLREYLKDHSRGKTVLNTFAYTGSLGAAAMAGGASRVLQTDLDRRFLNLGKDTYALNGFPVRRSDFLGEDFFPLVARLRRERAIFDTVILDPPFFSTTTAGKVDLQSGMTGLINKVRPLAADGGILIAVNNAVYLSGAEYLRELDLLTADGYMDIESLLPIGFDFTGTEETRVSYPPADPDPFNHSTKIAVLRVRKKNDSSAEAPSPQKPDF